jgi:methylmalonyl-CoA mutase N-terminal domain/subunit
MEREAWNILNKIEEQGGMLEAALSGWVQQQKAEYVRQYQEELNKKSRIIVGVNEFKSNESLPIEIFRIAPDFEKKKISSLKKLRRERDNDAIKWALEKLVKACKRKENTTLPTLDAVKTYASFGEIYRAMRQVYGEVTTSEMHSACVKV